MYHPQTSPGEHPAAKPPAKAPSGAGGGKGGNARVQALESKLEEVHGDCAGMDAWLDRAVPLNARRATPDDEHEIIEAAIQKFPADLVDKIEAKTEATKDAEEDLDDFYLVVLERA